VCAFLETIYSKAGYSVGCYTSPHLFKFNERIKINLEQLDDKTILKSLDFIQNKKKSIELTYFEITTLAAMNIFIEKEIDIAILEVGLGGRLDAVNIFDPEISIITSLGMDHQEYLGDSIEEIAYEKIGICRPNKNIILNFKDIPSSMLNSLNDLNVKVSKLNFDYSYKLNSKNYNYISQDFSIERLPLPHLNGSNQLMNLTGSLRIIDLFKKRFPVEQDAINKGIRETRIKGRLQVLSTEPYIIADVAHNVDAAINLYNFINTSKHSGKIFAIFSILENKDLKRVLMPFLDIVDEWNISEINDSRSQKIDVIETKLREYKNPVSINKFSSLTRAFENAQKKCNVNDNIIIFGSFLTVSEIMDGVKFNG
jgi:dihydrofolate synthase/folylpolyglutamate synthase